MPGPKPPEGKVMTSRSLALAALVLAGLTGGCSEPYESNTKNYLDLRTELNELLATVQDEASLDAALPRIEDLNRRIESNVAEREHLGKQTDTERRKALIRHQEAMKAQSMVYGAHMKRIDGIEGLPKDARQKLHEALKNVPPDS